MDMGEENLRIWFQSVDLDNSNTISSIELQQALEAGNMRFSLPTVTQMIRLYDRDLNGAMSFEEFSDLCKFLAKVQNAFATHERVDPLEEFGRNLQDSGSALRGVLPCKVSHGIQDPFEQWNRGFLPLNDVYVALQQLEYSLDQPAFYTVCQSFDSKNTGKFLLNDFICLCVFLQSARNLFQSFDRTKQGRVTFDFNQFVYCSANLRLN